MKKGQASQQLILKFKLSSTPRFACDASGVFRFAADAGVRLEFLRPMSGDACVVLQSADGGDALAQGLARMKQHSAVEWIEIDAVMKAL